MTSQMRDNKDLTTSSRAFQIRRVMLPELHHNSKRKACRSWASQSIRSVKRRELPALKRLRKSSRMLSQARLKTREYLSENGTKWPGRGPRRCTLVRTKRALVDLTFKNVVVLNLLSFINVINQYIQKYQYISVIL